jgi:hypothetical protein
MAQTTKAAIDALISTNLADNTTEDITPLDVRQVESAMSDSYQIRSVEVSGSITALIDGDYINTATATYTNPTVPVQGKGFTVTVRNGTATVGGVAYAIEGTVIKRIFHSGTWANFVYQTSDVSLKTFDVTIAGGAAIQELASAPIEIIPDVDGNYFQLFSATVINLGDGDTDYDFAKGLHLRGPNGSNARVLMATLGIGVVDPTPTFEQGTAFNVGAGISQFITAGASNTDNIGPISLSAQADATEGNHSLRVFGSYIKFPA